MNLPSCPYCGSKMLPQVTVDKLVSYRCTNKSCLAVSPHSDTFAKALEKAIERTEKPLVWHDRKTEFLTKQGEYLCEYVFDPESPLRVVFYGILSWYANLNRFQHERDGYVWNGQRLIVLRWMDFGGSIL